MMYYWMQTLLVSSVVFYSVIYLLRTFLPAVVSRATQAWMPKRLRSASSPVLMRRGCGISCHACKGCSLATLHKTVKSVTSHV